MAVSDFMFGPSVANAPWNPFASQLTPQQMAAGQQMMQQWGQPAQPTDAAAPPNMFGGPQAALTRSDLNTSSSYASPSMASADLYSRAIANKESGGRYDLLGPTTKGGDYAVGKYQVMASNIGQWTAEALGKPMNVADFRRSPEAQEAVFQHKFGQYVNKYGPEGAARAWFAGEGGMHNPNARDAFGTTVSGYGRDFMNYLRRYDTGNQ